MLRVAEFFSDDFMKFDPTKLDSYPIESGIYIMKNVKGEVIYVGKANSLKKRLKQYFVPGRDNRATIPLLLQELCFIETLVVSSEKEALLLENNFIKKYQPKFNILLKDDKNYISLCINPHEKWPKLELLRFKAQPKDGALYFGPYTSTLAARETYELMSRLFPLRQCSNEEFNQRTRPCLLYSIKRCIAPCVQKCSEEEYKTFVKSAIEFLKGNNQKIIKELKEKMQKASDALEYEKADSFLRTIKQIEHVTHSPTIFQKSKNKEIDVIGLYREGDLAAVSRIMFKQGKIAGSEFFSFEHTLESDEELISSFVLQHYPENAPLPEELLLPLEIAESKSLSSILKESHPSQKGFKLLFPKKGDAKDLLDLAMKNAKTSFLQRKDAKKTQEKLLLSLQEKLSLNRFPKKIECFDTSHMAGSHLVASQVVFTDGKEDKKKMRLYHIKDVHKPDDYAAIHQVLSRRLTRSKEEDDFPDLIIIDGGKGQLNTALQVLKELEIVNVDLISLVKEKGRHDKGLTLERVCTLKESEPISFPAHSPLLFFLQKIRDLAHEKAISFYRKSHSKKNITSALDTIPGIGPLKRKRLLTAFGSPQNVFAQTKESLQKVKGITEKDIQEIQKKASS